MLLTDFDDTSIQPILVAIDAKSDQPCMCLELASAGTGLDAFGADVLQRVGLGVSRCQKQTF